MEHLTRRSAAALLLLALAAGLGLARGSLMAIDLGSEFVRVCLLRPGSRSPIQIVVNEMSRRKSPALVGVVNGDRLLGEEAATFSVRYPTTVFARTRDMLARSAGDAYVQNLLKGGLLPYELVDHPERKTVMARANSTAAYLAEELVAGVLQYAKQITDAQAGAPVVDAVITVPAWYGIAQRQALKDAAALAGLNVLALVNTHSAAALQFGIERDFAAKEQKVIFYDMGSGSTEVALVKYSTYNAKEPGSAKPKAINQFEVLDAEWDAELGANDLDMILLYRFAEQFNEKFKAKEDVRDVPKAVAKLKRQVRRTKEILSANTDAPFSVEELHDGRDFQSTVSRADFEELAEKAGFWARAAAPLKRLMERNGLKPGDIDAVEMLGGGSRVPRLQSALSEVLGGRALDRHLDADEAIVLGGALFAANLSTSFRLRKFGMTDVAMYGVSWISEDLKGALHHEGEDAEHPDPKEVKHIGPLVKNLLPAGKKLPIKRAIKFNNLTNDAFSFRLEYNTSAMHGLPPGHTTGPVIAQYDVSGITDAITRYNHSGVTALRFEADWSGLVALDKAECVVEAEVLEDKVIEVPAEEGDDKDAADKDGKEGGKEKEKEKDDGKGKGKEEGKGKEDAGKGKDEKAEEEGKDKDEKPGKEDGKEDDKEEGDASADKKGAKKDEKPKTVFKKIQVPKRRTFHVALKVGGAGFTHPPLSGGVLTAAQANITAFVLREAVKRDTARAKNDLESYIIGTREKLEDEGYVAVTTEEQRSEFREALMDAEDWLYGDGEHEAAAGYRKKLSELRAVGNPIARRAAERAARPKVVGAAREAAELALKVAGLWGETKPWINATDAEAMVDKIKAFLKWLEDQEAAQAKKAPHEEPAFETDSVSFRWELLSKAFDRLNNKKKPRPPPAKAKANATEGGEAGAGAGAGAGAEGVEGAAQGEEGQEQQQEPEGEGQQQQEERAGEAGQQQQGAGGREEEEEDQPKEEL